MTNPAILELNAVDNTSHAFATAQAGLKQFERASKGAQQASNNFARSNNLARGGMQQMGYQIQDIAVQLQAGQSPFIILSQQGSQVASIFGPSGAVIGALLAVGGVIGMTLLPNLFKAEKETESLAEATRRLTEDLKFATEAQRAYVAAQEAGGAAAEIKSLEEMNDRMVELATTRERLTQLLAMPMGAIDPRALATYSKMLEQVKTEETELHVEIDNKRMGSAVETHQALLKAEEILSEAFAGFADKRREDDEKAAKSRLDTEAMLYETFAGFEQKRVEDALKAARERIDTEAMLYETFAGFEQKRADDREKLGSQLSGVVAALMTETEQVDQLYREQLDIVTSARAEGLIVEQDYSDTLVRIASERQESLAEIDRRQADSVAAAQAAVTRALSDNLSRQVDSLAAAFDDSTAIGKAFYLVQRGMAAANAVISGYSAAGSIRAAYATLAMQTGNPALAAGGETHAQLSIALGYATAGAIAGQTLASFDGGGFTGYGARAGGMDGKGGFAAILHPNESVVDHTKGGGGAAINVTIQANDTRGFDQLLQSRRGIIAKMINDAVNNQGRRAVV